MWCFFKSLLGNGTVTACSHGSCLQVRTKWLRSIFKAIILSVSHMIIPVSRYFMKSTIFPYKQNEDTFIYCKNEIKVPYFDKFCVHFCLSKLCILNMYLKCFELRFLGKKLTVTFSFAYLSNLYLMLLIVFKPCWFIFSRADFQGCLCSYIENLGK